MKCLIDTHDTNKGSFPELELTEEQFLEHQHAYNNATKEGSFLDIIATFHW